MSIVAIQRQIRNQLEGRSEHVVHHKDYDDDVVIVIDQRAIEGGVWIAPTFLKRKELTSEQFTRLSRIIKLGYSNMTYNQFYRYFYDTKNSKEKK